MTQVRYPIVELRQYTLRSGQRDVLIELFDRELVESQEAAGMAVVGQFRDLDRPDMFVWIRGFASMPSRATALASFYGGQHWKAHSAAANATMIDSDDVLLLRPTEVPHPPPPSHGPAWGLGQVWHPHPDLETAHATLERILDTPVAVWRTEHSENTFPQLPVRDGDHVVWLATFTDETRWAEAEHRLTTDPSWHPPGPAEWLRLLPSG